MTAGVGDTAGMSLDGLVEEVGRALAGAIGLFGVAPVSGVWESTGGLSAGRDAVARAGGAAAQSWRGVGASGYVSDGNGLVSALHSVIEADAGTGAGFGASADASARGGTGMDTVIDDTRSAVSAVAPSTDTPAGKAQLVAHLQHQLQRAKTLLVAAERRNIELAAIIRAAAGGYRASMAGPAMMPMGAGPAIPATTSGGGVRGIGLPDAAGLAGAGEARRALMPDPHTGYAPASGSAAQTAVRAALSKLGRPYVWGAKGPDAFDCSGLVGWSWAQAGVTLARDTYSQIEQGTPVVPGDVQAGDMIFPLNSFGEDGRPGPGHVMLAISPTECAEAQQAGVPVKISPMPSAYIARRPLAG